MAEEKDKTWPQKKLVQPHFLREYHWGCLQEWFAYETSDKFVLEIFSPLLNSERARKEAQPPAMKVPNEVKQADNMNFYFSDCFYSGM
jgi:hypothetical protein